MDKYDVGVITDCRIGCNFALSLKENGYSCVLFHTGLEKMSRDDIDNYVSEMQQKGVHTATSVDITINLLKTPRKLFIVSKSSIYSEDILSDLFELIDDKDIIIDTCDADYNTTASRCRMFEKQNAYYLGVGFSGEAAERLNGYSFMVGGSKDAYNDVCDILKDISSKFDGEECCAYIGPDGAGHYAKMINNGIEYGVMQSICESVSVLEHIEDFDDTILYETLNEWAMGENNSFLLQAVIEIVKKRVSGTEELYKNVVSDKVGNSKSVLWMCASAAELSEPIPSIYAALGHRFMSGLKKERSSFAPLAGIEKVYVGIKQREKKNFITDIKNSLYLAMICVHAQAFNLLRHRSAVGIWGTSSLNVAVTYQGGAFIRSKLMARIIDAYKNKPDLKNLLEDAYFLAVIKRYLPSLQNVVAKAAESGIAVPVFAASLSYIICMAQEEMNTGLLALIRDYTQGTGFEMRNTPKIRYSADWSNLNQDIEMKEIRK